MEATKLQADVIDPASIEIHPDANTVRMMDQAEFAALREDIREHGQLVPATICQGKLLDGRNRQRACIELGIPLRVENAGDSDVDTVAMVYSLNVTRRHLNTAERAFMGADLANLEHGSNQHRAKEEIQNGSPKDSRKYTRHEAATVVECSPQDITAARNVRKYAPELEEKAKAGEMHIREAERLAKEKAQPKTPKKKVTPITPTTETVDKAATWDDLLECVDSDTDLLTAAKEDMLHPQFMVAKGLEQSRELIIRNMGGLNRKDRKQAMRAVYAVLEHYQATFNAELKANLSATNKALQAQLKDQVAEQKALTKQAQALLKSRFDKSDFRKIRSVLHTDKQPTDSQRAEAFDLLLKLEPLFS